MHWIATKDELPPVGEWVFVLRTNGIATSAKLMKNGCWAGHGANYAWKAGTVSHWMRVIPPEG